MSTWIPMLAQPPMDSYMETWVTLCDSVCVSQSPCFWSQTLVRMCTCISTWIYVHLTTHVYSTPLCIVGWKHGCPCVALCVCHNHPTSGHTSCLECVHPSVHVFMSTWLPMSALPLCIVWWKPGCPCMTVCLYPSHFISVPTPCLECVHATVHVFMSTQLPMLAQPPMDSYMEMGAPVWQCVCVPVTSFLLPHLV